MKHLIRSHKTYNQRKKRRSARHRKWMDRAEKLGIKIDPNAKYVLFNEATSQYLGERNVSVCPFIVLNDGSVHMLVPTRRFAKIFKSPTYGWNIVVELSKLKGKGKWRIEKYN